MGCVHIYCGEGKGKTTAAVGLAVRMAGGGGQAVVARFLKTEDSGEVRGLRQIEGIEVIPCGRTFGFTWQMTEAQKAEAAQYYEGLLRTAVSRSLLRAAEGERVLLVLDEICAAVNSGLVEEGAVTSFLDTRPAHLEVVMTGREPSRELLVRADYISRIEKVRHPFDRGLEAREGIEY